MPASTKTTVLSSVRKQLTVFGKPAVASCAVPAITSYALCFPNTKTKRASAACVVPHYCDACMHAVPAKLKQARTTWANNTYEAAA
jgi:hypothetical protein